MQSNENIVGFLERAKQDMLKYEQNKSSFWRPRRIIENRLKMVTSIKNEIKIAEDNNDDTDLIMCYIMTDCYLEKSIREERIANPAKQDFSLLKCLIADSLLKLIDGKIACKKFNIANFRPIKTLIEEKINLIKDTLDDEIKKLNGKILQSESEKLELSNLITQNNKLIEELKKTNESSDKKIIDLTKENQEIVSQLKNLKNDDEIQRLQSENNALIDKMRGTEQVIAEIGNLIYAISKINGTKEKLNQVEVVNTVNLNKKIISQDNRAGSVQVVIVKPVESNASCAC